MSETLPNFELVGYRFARLLVDEEPYNAMSDEGVLTVTLKTEQPSISEFKYQERQVIELAVKIEVELAPETKLSRDIASRTVIDVRCIAGFVASDQAHDGDLSSFTVQSPTFARSLYWLARQRVTSLLSMTKLRGATLPLDLRQNALSTRDTAEQPTLE